MALPTTLDGLNAALQALGYDDLVTGLDLTDPTSKQVLLDQITFVFESSDQTLQDQARYRKATSMVERFQWPSVTSARAMVKALHVLKELQALLRHDVPAPEGAEMEVMNFEVEEEDEDGLPMTVSINYADANTPESDESSSDDLCDCVASSGVCRDSFRRRSRRSSRFCCQQLRQSEPQNRRSTPLTWSGGRGNGSQHQSQ